MEELIMQVKELIKILEKCDENDEITFIFDNDDKLSTNRGEGLFEVSQVNVTGQKINGKIALSNGRKSSTGQLRKVKKQCKSLHQDRKL